MQPDETRDSFAEFCRGHRPVIAVWICNPCGLRRLDPLKPEISRGVAKKV